MSHKVSYQDLEKNSDKNEKLPKANYNLKKYTK